jgi:hypothetical protein
VLRARFLLTMIRHQDEGLSALAAPPAPRVPPLDMSTSAKSDRRSFSRSVVSICDRTRLSHARSGAEAAFAASREAGADLVKESLDAELGRALRPPLEAVGETRFKMRKFHAGV